MNTPNQQKKEAARYKKRSETLNAFLQPIIERIIEEKMNVYKVSLKDSLLDNFKDRKDISIKEIEDFFEINK